MKATGIHIDGLSLRLASFAGSGRSVKQLVYKTTPLTPAVKPLYMGWEQGVLVSPLLPQDLLIRSLPVALKPSRSLHRALSLQMEAQTHFPPEELVTTLLIEPKHKRATAYATTRSALQEHRKALLHYHLEPDRICPAPAAFQAFVHWKAPHLRSYFLVDLGCRFTHCLWVEEGAVKRAHTIEIGTHHLASAFHEDKKKTITLKEHLDFSLLRMGQYPTLSEQARNFRREISKQLYAFACRRPLVWTGDLEIREFLMETVGDLISEEAKLSLTPEEQTHALPAGLAIEALLNQKSSLQFKTENRQSARTWRKLGKIAAALLLASTVLSAVFYQLGSWWMDRREMEISRSLEAWVSAKDPSLRLELFSQGPATTEDLVNKWLSLIDRHEKDYPFINRAPLVAESLNWLLNHPAFAPGEEKPFLQRFRYHLASLPKLDAPKEPYLAHIEFEFSLSSPLLARKFHEAIIRDDLWIDTKREIGWETLPDRYKTSFYLRNRHL